MLAIILPGYSSHNRSWAEDIIKNVLLPYPIFIHEWRHWSQGGGLSESYEVAKIIDEIGNEKVNIIAKSVGTRITMRLLPSIVNLVEKVILCGIPTKFEGPDIKDLYTQGIKSIPPSKFLIIQNTSDPFSPFAVVDEAIHSIEPQIKIVEKPASTHDYPYFEDFENFLRS